ncbi:hypothetical protein Cantr_08671 [Candida viswanathii]|uniref:Uncharacterized protein n=1 Tax=Candida viswanathii TaxID=5486 RepID=A0A367Y3W4_9ASCO|nr:hypothetical protein Cantr_08671 [Candida viswanathii]
MPVISQLKATTATSCQSNLTTPKFWYRPCYRTTTITKVSQEISIDINVPKLDSFPHSTSTSTNIAEVEMQSCLTTSYLLQNVDSSADQLTVKTTTQSVSEELSEDTTGLNHHTKAVSNGEVTNSWVTEVTLRVDHEETPRVL